MLGLLAGCAMSGTVTNRGICSTGAKAMTNETAGRRIRMAERKTALMGGFELGPTSELVLGCDQEGAFFRRRPNTAVGVTG